MTADQPDADLVRRAQRGDQAAFGHLASRYRQRVFALLKTLLLESASAEDVTQDALVRAWLRLERFDRKRPFYPWLATIAVRLAWNSERGRAVLLDEEALARTASPEGGPAQSAEASETSEQLWAAVTRLARGERTSLILFYRDELTVPEIAMVLGVTSGTVKTWLHRGRAHLKQHLPPGGLNAGDI